MRRFTFVLTFILSISGVAAAQEMADFVNLADGFKVTLPGQPTMTNAMWTSEHGYPLPAHVYTLNRGNERYKITVADYRYIEQEGIKRAQGCNPPANICTGNANTGEGFWKHDVRGATIFGALSLIKRDGVRVSDMVWAQHNRIEGIELQLQNTDGSRTYGYIAMHAMKLYITEATMPRTSPPATLFQTSMEFVDPMGATYAYQFIYSNTFHGLGIYPPPPRGGVPPGGWERPIAAGAIPPAAAPAGGRGGAPAGGGRGGRAGGAGGAGQ